MCPMANQLPLRNQKLEQESRVSESLVFLAPVLIPDSFVSTELCVFMRACRQSMACSSLGP